MLQRIIGDVSTDSSRFGSTILREFAVQTAVVEYRYVIFNDLALTLMYPFHNSLIFLDFLNSFEMVCLMRIVKSFSDNIAVL